MNITSLNNFKKEVNQVKEYLKHIEIVDNIIAYSILENDNDQIKKILNNLKEHSNSFKRDKKIFEYKAAIISLYGLLEKYIETWIKEYLESLCRVVRDYNEIDEIIKNNHFEFSLKLINSIISRESAKYQALTKEKVLEKLNNCIASPTNYQINTEAFVLLSGNLKHKKIVELFKHININLNNELVKNENLNKEIGLSKDRISHEDKDILYNKINDLVERRNQIAHGSETLEILGISALEPYVQFLEVYCQAIFEALFENLIKQESKYAFQKIEKIIKVYGNKILAFEVENYTVKVGDMLIIEAQESRFFKKPILTIQLDSEEYQELRISEKTKIAISVEHKIKDNQKFYIVKKS
jgi:hypothetical protein